MAGGIPAVMNRIADDLRRDAPTVSGRTIGQIAAEAQILDEKVIPARENAAMPEGGTVALFGGLAPEGAVVKQSAVSPQMRTFSGPARVFDSEADCLAAIREQRLAEGEVLVIRYEGPKGAPGMPELLAVTMALDLYGFSRVGLVTDGRFSGATSGPCVGHVSPEAYDKGPIALVRDGDEITIDIPNRRLDVRLSSAQMQSRAAAWKRVEKEAPSGYMRRYRRLVSSAAKGAVLS
jgi:dihydroxy-acid dehydratase